MHTILQRYTLSLWLGPSLKSLQRIRNRAVVKFTLSSQFIEGQKLVNVAGPDLGWKMNGDVL